MDMIKRKKAQGTLQFSRSNAAKLPTGRHRWYTEEEDFEPDAYSPHSPILGFEKQLPRVKDLTLHHKLMSPDDRRAISKLPTHMHTITNRMICGNKLEKTLRETKH